jgi:purine-nucleoside phosphorylase
MIERSGLTPHDVLTVGAVTTDLDLGERLGEGWTVEHLEAYAVAWACARSSIPFVAVLGITNTVGPDAHLQWLTHRDQAQSTAREAVQALLQES